MAKLTGIDIYKLLPRTNCGDCGFSTCMAFAMQVAAKKVALDKCPHVSEEAKAALGEAQAPPMRTVSIGSGQNAVTVGGETVLFRHEEKFHRPPGIAITVGPKHGPVASRISCINKLKFVRVGQELKANLVAVQSDGLDGSGYAALVQTVRENTDLPMILVCPDPTALASALPLVAKERPLLWAATKENWEEMGKLARDHQVPLVARAETLADLAWLVEKLRGLGVEDIVLDPAGKGLKETISKLIDIRRLALEKNFRPLGFPVLVFVHGRSAFEAVAHATAYICKYANILVLEDVEPEVLLPIFTVSQNLYTDPQKPNAIEAKLYEVGQPDSNSPVLVTTNFALTFYTVAGEVENSKVPAYIVVVDTGGLGVLNAYADDKFTAQTIIKAVKEQGVWEKVSHRKLVIPGLVAVLKWEIEDETGWEVIVGPEDAAGIPHFLRNVWPNL